MLRSVSSKVMWVGRARVFVVGLSVMLALASAAAILMVALVWSKLAEAAFPGSSGRIVFDSDRDGNYEIYTMNGDGSDQSRLTFTPRAIETNAAFSSDGTKIAFDRSRRRLGSPDVWNRIMWIIER
jgi:hypothetical protein